MFYLKVIIFCTINLLLINKFLTSKKILLHQNSNHQHKDKFKKNIPLSSGLYFLLCFIFLSIITNYNYYYILVVIFCTPMLLIGLLADINYDLKPAIRLFFSFLIIISIVLLLDIFIYETGINFLDYFLKNKVISILFTSFCILILVNGFNFIDGTHGNLALYNVLLYFFIFYFYIQNINLNLYYSGLIIIFLIFTILNFFEKNFMGDNGSYFLGIVTGIIAIMFYKNNNLSSLYIVNILSYPAIEVLWSMIRKYLQKKSVEFADRLHLHHLILIQFKRKNNHQISSIFTSITIFTFNFIFIKIASEHPFDKYYQLKILITYFLCYVFFYLFLFKIKKK